MIDEQTNYLRCFQLQNLKSCVVIILWRIKVKSFNRQAKRGLSVSTDRQIKLIDIQVITQQAPSACYYYLIPLLPHNNIYLFYSMSFQALYQSDPQLPTPSRIIDVILLTDNREITSNDRTLPDYRCSAFKQTEVDPLEERQKDYLSLGGQSWEDLVKRVSRLEKKVEELQHLEAGVNARGQAKGKKLRRKFSQINRNYQCSHCRKLYGSETALKCHQKLKHTPKLHQQDQ